MVDRRVGRADAFLAVFEIARRFGLPHNELLSIAGLQRQQARWLDTPVEGLSRVFAPISHWVRVVDALDANFRSRDLVAAGVEALPSLEGFGHLGHVLLTAADLNAALQSIEPGFRVLTNFGHWSACTTAKQFVLRWDRAATSPGMALGNEMVVAHMATVVLQQVTDASIPIRKLTFRHPSRWLPAAHVSELNIPIEYEASMDSIVLDREVLALKPRLSNRHLHQCMWSLLNDELSSPSLAMSTRDRVRGVLRTSPPRQDLSLQPIATRLGVTRRTLQRMLASENSSFREELARALTERARERVLGTNTPLKEIAHRLGYGPAAFSRAYRNAWGETPTETRKRVRSYPGKP